MIKEYADKLMPLFLFLAGYGFCYFMQVMV